MQQHIFFDLEDTVITPATDGWWKTELIHQETIQKILRRWPGATHHLFSFALHDARQLRLFNEGTRPMLEQSLGSSLVHTPTVDDDILPVCCKVKGLIPSLTSFTDMVEFWGKDLSFKMWIRDWLERHPSKEPRQILFLDDAVQDEDVVLRFHQAQVFIRNIDSLVQDFERHW